jgi:hypothetical protein
MANSQRLAELRERLANVSWFMRCLWEKIARDANHEDGSCHAADWTGRELRADKRGSIPDHLAPIMDRLGINRSNWVETVRSGLPEPIENQSAE